MEERKKKQQTATVRMRMDLVGPCRRRLPTQLIKVFPREPGKNYQLPHITPAQKAKEAN